MFDINQVKEGDVIVWESKCGEVRGTVKRLDNGVLLAVTDGTHGIPVEHLCYGNNSLLPCASNHDTIQSTGYDNDASVPVLF